MVAIVMTTYSPPEGNPRFTYAKRCIRALDDLVGVPDETPLNFILADDGSGDDYLANLKDLVAQWSYEDATYITGPHNGIGSSLNRAMMLVPPGAPWLYTTDDWLLVDMLSLDLPLWLLDAGYDMVRLGPIHPNLTCKTQFTSGHGWWLDVDVHSNQYAAATRPFLASPRLAATIGPWLEGVDAYECERDFARRCSEAGITIAAINLGGPWEHIGEFEVGDRPIC